jgi:hypothetical protein
VSGEAQLVDLQTGEILVPRLELAASFWRRFCGWQGRALPPPGTGLLIAPCNSIHTCWMRFSIDVAFLDDRGGVLAVRSSVRPWRIVWPVRRARFVVEIPAGRGRLATGQRLAISGGPRSGVLAALAFDQSAD